MNERKSFDMDMDWVTPLPGDVLDGYKFCTRCGRNEFSTPIWPCHHSQTTSRCALWPYCMLDPVDKAKYMLKKPK